MPLMEWSERMSVGVGQFDDEHKKLIAMINELFDAVQSGRGKEALGGILDRLIEYTKTHFSHEEHYMQKHGYPDMAAHRKEHEILTKQVVEIQRKYHSGATAMLSMEVMTFLKNWLIKHIQGTDKLYTPFFHDKGMH
ncbi:MAG: bacteriohemerythrin [Azospirillum sp.]|nr:bacteriohemerythrin [Azospirillum sp.]